MLCGVTWRHSVAFVTRVARPRQSLQPGAFLWPLPTPPLPSRLCSCRPSPVITCLRSPLLCLAPARPRCTSHHTTLPLREGKISLVQTWFSCIDPGSLVFSCIDLPAPHTNVSTQVCNSDHSLTSGNILRLFIQVPAQYLMFCSVSSSNIYLYNITPLFYYFRLIICQTLFTFTIFWRNFLLQLTVSQFDSQFSHKFYEHFAINTIQIYWWL